MFISTVNLYWTVINITKISFFYHFGKKKKKKNSVGGPLEWEDGMRLVRTKLHINKSW